MLSFILLFMYVVSGTCARPIIFGQIETINQTQEVAHIAASNTVAARHTVLDIAARQRSEPTLTIAMTDITKDNPSVLTIYRGDDMISHSSIEKTPLTNGNVQIDLRVVSHDIHQQQKSFSFCTSPQYLEESPEPQVIANNPESPRLITLQYKLPKATDEERYTLAVMIELDNLPEFSIACNGRKSFQKMCIFKHAKNSFIHTDSCGTKHHLWKQPRLTDNVHALHWW